MTTIATDGVTIAADGLVHADGQQIIKNQKKIRVGTGGVGGVVYALAGTSCLLDPVIAWVEAGAEPSRAPAGDNEWSLLVMRAFSVVVYTNKCLYPEAQYFPFTMGTGREYALMALKLGKTPAEAVALAMECDLYTAGEIQVVDLPWRQAVAVKNGAGEYQHPYDRFEASHPL